MRRRGREESPEVDVSSVFDVDLNHESHPYWILPLSAILFSISIRSSQEAKWTWSFMWEPRVWDFVPLSVQNCQDSRYNYHLYLMNFLPYLHNMWVVPQCMWPHFITVYLYFFLKKKLYLLQKMPMFLGIWNKQLTLMTEVSQTSSLLYRITSLSCSLFRLDASWT